MKKEDSRHLFVKMGKLQGMPMYVRWPKWLTFDFRTTSQFRIPNSEFRIRNSEL